MRKARIALIGAGNIANTHLTSYAKNPEAEVVAICDINPEKLAKTADKFGIPNRYTSIDELLANEKDLDAADICVWNVSHADCAMKALNAGLDVLCEKPMAYTVELSKQMEECAKKNGKLLMIGFVTRFAPQTKVVKDFIDKGYLGDIYYSKGKYIRRHGNPGGWFCDKERSGGGPVIDLGVHVIDRVRYLMGRPMPVSVYAATFSKLGKRDNLKTNVGWSPEDARPEDKCDVEDFATALIRFDNGAVFSLETSFSLNAESENGLDLMGTKGGMKTGDKLKMYTEMNDFLADVDIDTENLKDGKYMFDAEMDHFVDCVLGKTECQVDVHDGVVVMEILEAMYESARTGHEVILKK